MADRDRLRRSDGVPSPPATGDARVWVLVDLGWPVRGRRGYRGVGTAAGTREDARDAARCLEARRAGGPVCCLTPRAAGTRLLIEALAADGAGGLAADPRESA